MTGSQGQLSLQPVVSNECKILEFDNAVAIYIPCNRGLAGSSQNNAQTQLQFREKFGSLTFWKVRGCLESTLLGNLS